MKKGWRWFVGLAGLAGAILVMIIATINIILMWLGYIDALTIDKAFWLEKIEPFMMIGFIIAALYGLYLFVTRVDA
jgi:hypothetical protein